MRTANVPKSHRLVHIVRQTQPMNEDDAVYPEELETSAIGNFHFFLSKLCTDPTQLCRFDSTKMLVRTISTSYCV